MAQKKIRLLSLAFMIVLSFCDVLCQTTENSMAPGNNSTNVRLDWEALKRWFQGLDVQSRENVSSLNISESLLKYPWRHNFTELTNYNETAIELKNESLKEFKNESDNTQRKYVVSRWAIIRCEPDVPHSWFGCFRRLIWTSSGSMWENLRLIIRDNSMQIGGTINQARHYDWRCPNENPQGLQEFHLQRCKACGDQFQTNFHCSPPSDQFQETRRTYPFNMRSFIFGLLMGAALGTIGLLAFCLGH